MAEITSGLRAVLNAPSVYRFFQWAIGAHRLRRHFAQRVLAPGRLRVVDVGCGPADMLDYLPNVDYVGFDLSADYIAAAQRRYGDRGSFWQRQIDSTTSLDQGSFDRVLAIGLLHHLDDEAARRLFSLARSLLNPGGLMLTIDICYDRRQHWLGRWLTSLDRGQNVRTSQDYLQLALPQFPAAQAECRHDLLNLPYSHTILSCPL